MKKRIGWALFGITAVFCFLAYFAKAESITYLEHQKEINKLICDCQKQKEAPAACEKKLNATSTANASNKKTMIDDVNSAICLGYLKEMGCGDILNESTQGPCDLKELQK